jgi:SlyX protein
VKVPQVPDLPSPFSAAAGAFEARLTELEIKASFAEDTIDRLNEVIVRQQTQIDALLREVAHLRQQGAGTDAPGFTSLRDELPPHY